MSFFIRKEENIFVSNIISKFTNLKKINKINRFLENKRRIYTPTNMPLPTMKAAVQYKWSPILKTTRCLPVVKKRELSTSTGRKKNVQYDQIRLKANSSNSENYAKKIDKKNRFSLGLTS